MTTESKTLKARLWRHKETKKTCKATPWWELMPSKYELNHKEMPAPEIGVPWKFGMLVQIGWLLENQQGVWLGVGPDAAQHFDDVTEPEQPPKDAETKV